MDSTSVQCCEKTCLETLYLSADPLSPHTRIEGYLHYASSLAEDLPCCTASASVRGSFAQEQARAISGQVRLVTARISV